VIYTAPPPKVEEISQYYPAQYHVYNPPVPLRGSLIGNALRQLAMWPYRLRFGDPDWTMRPFGAGKLLDVGCGTGRFLKQAADLGWHCWGLDLSPFAVEKARQYVPQATIFEGTLESLPIQEAFDVIVMSQVLEHVPQPVATLQRCLDLLLPGGRLIISIPNVVSWESRVFGKYWVGLDIPRHLVHFPEAVLRRLLANLGLSVQIRPAMFASSISESLILTLPDSIRYRVLYSRLSRYLYLLTVFPAAFSYLLGNRGVIEIVAQKPG
jgi:2-polyprenyl-3-methyl-5-hydroxy-6-metoxy-1,4-benzoquinol methylase